MLHYSQLNKEDFELAVSQLYSLGAGWQESIQDQASEQSPYKAIDISSLLPQSLSSLGQSGLSSPGSPEELLTNLRQSHVSILSGVSDSTEYLPEQLAFNDLVSGESINALQDNPYYQKLQEEPIPHPGFAAYQGDIEQIVAPSSGAGSSSSQMPSSSRTPQVTRPEPSGPSRSQVPTTPQAASPAEQPTTTTATTTITSSSAKGKEPYRPQLATRTSDLGLARIDQLAESKGPAQIEAKRLKEQIDKLYPKLSQTTDEADAQQLVEELITPLERLVELEVFWSEDSLGKACAQDYLVKLRDSVKGRKLALDQARDQQLIRLLERSYSSSLKQLVSATASSQSVQLIEVLEKLAALSSDQGAITQDLSLYTDAAILYQHILSICAKEQDTLDSKEAASLQNVAYQGLAQLQASMLA